MATQTYSLLSAPRIPTHRGEAGARDSTIDLAWINLAASIKGMFVGVVVDWTGSYGSDHALLRLPVQVRGTVRNPRSHRPTKFDTDLDLDEWDWWRQILNDFTPSPDVALLSVTLQRALLSDLDKGTSFNGKDASAPRCLA